MFDADIAQAALELHKILGLSDVGFILIVILTVTLNHIKDIHRWLHKDPHSQD